MDSNIEIASLSRPHFNEVLKDLYAKKSWESQPPVFDEREDPSAKMDFLKERVGIEVGFGHASFIGIDLLKFPRRAGIKNLLLLDLRRTFATRLLGTGTDIITVQHLLGHGSVTTT